MEVKLKHTWTVWAAAGEALLLWFIVVSPAQSQQFTGHVPQVSFRTTVRTQIENRFSFLGSFLCWMLKDLNELQVEVIEDNIQSPCYVQQYSQRFIWSWCETILWLKGETLSAETISFHFSYRDTLEHISAQNQDFGFCPPSLALKVPSMNNDYSKVNLPWKLTTSAVCWLKAGRTTTFGSSVTHVQLWVTNLMIQLQTSNC